MNFLYIGRQIQNKSKDSTVVHLNIDRYDEIVVLKEYKEFDIDYRLDSLCKEWIKYFISSDIIIIELDWFEKNDYIGVRFTNHIRLTKWSDERLRDIPIVLVRENKIDIVNNDTFKDDLLIFSGQGALFTTYSDIGFDVAEDSNYDSFTTNIARLTRKHNRQYTYERYLTALNFSEQYEDSHSITNQWGALRLAANVGYSPEDVVYSWPPKLYFKYLQEKYKFDSTADKVEIIAKVLLIDDNADKGWEKVLKKIFNFSDKNPTLDEKGNPTFVTINEKVSSYDKFSDENKRTIEEQDFDLYLVDLRLNGQDEDDTSETKNFSGATVLQKIKSINAGNQVIMFTASNKAWNMRTLLNGENAADGYYIKESPLNAPDKFFGKNNTAVFIEQVQQSLQSRFLKKIAIIEMKCKDYMNSNFDRRMNSYKEFYNRADSSLKIAFELCKKSMYDKKYLNLAYLTYYQILEDYSSQNDNFEFVSKRECYVSRNIRVIDDSSGQLLWHLNYVQNKKDGDYFKKNIAAVSGEIAVQYLAKISFILSYKFEKSDHFLMAWGVINNIRNEKAGHGGRKGYVTQRELFPLLEIVELFLTNR
ncbi:MAG: hypothetical protein H7319_15355 [Spirosoma sp.]|nr:hypothetical protein [Spirosoma sp.]